MEDIKGLILLANEFEDIEGLGTIDLLRRANLSVDLVSITGNKEIITQSKIKITADKLVEEIDVNDYNFLIIPGGAAVKKTHLSSNITISIINTFMKKKQLIATICAAPSILGTNGYLKDKNYVCFPEFEKLVKGGNYQETKNVVVSDNIITSKAAGTTFNFAYEIIKYLKNEETAKQVLNSVFYKI